MCKEQQLLHHFYQFVSDHKKKLFSQIIEKRTRHFTVVLEDIFQPHNASAVLRNCDCFGIQDVHIIENENQYKVNPDVALGSSKWLGLNYYNQEENNTVNCFNTLKKEGYKVIVTTPHNNSITLPDFNIEKKSAFVFGTELRGVSKVAINHADGYLKIPMYGFTESFNISVSVAIILSSLRQKLNESSVEWGLKEEEKLEVLLNWCRETIKKSHLIEKTFSFAT